MILDGRKANTYRNQLVNRVKICIFDKLDV